jgi:Ca-activated chloride channel family protein
MTIRPELSVLPIDRPSLRGVSARGRIDGLMLRMDLEQTYVNAGRDPLEVVFTFPLPLAATLLGVEADVAGRRLNATVMARERAEQGYEEAIEEGDSAVMVECARDGLFTVNLGNLLPGDTLKLTLRYGQMLRFEQGIVRVTLPTALGQWYGDAVRQGSLAPHQIPETGGLDDYPFDLSIRISGALADAQAECVTHAITHRREGTHRVVCFTERAWLDRDFVLTFSGLPSLSAAVRVPDYASPEGADASEVVIASLCPRIGDAVQARVDLKMLVDCSGSMVGASIDAARRALAAVIDELRPDDRFSFGRFGNGVEQLFASMQPAVPESLARARGELNLLAADMGGTEMHRALLGTLALKGEMAAPSVLLITDGEVWEIDRIVEAASRGRQRIFAIGVGSAPSESLLRALTERTGGACDIVPPGEDMEQAVMRMFRRIRQQGAMTVSVDWGAQPLWQAPLPEAVYAGDTVHLMASFRRGVPVRPVLSLQSADERCSMQSPPAQYCADTEASRLAAARRISALAGKALQAWAVRYQLVSEATHMLLVVNRDIKAGKAPKLERIRHTVPAALLTNNFRVMRNELPPSHAQGICFSMELTDTAGFEREGVAPVDRAVGDHGQAVDAKEMHDELRQLVDAVALDTGDWGRMAERLAGRLDLAELRKLANICEPTSIEWPLAALALCEALAQVRPLSRHTMRAIRIAVAQFDTRTRVCFQAWIERVRPLLG